MKHGTLRYSNRQADRLFPGPTKIIDQRASINEFDSFKMNLTNLEREFSFRYDPFPGSERIQARAILYKRPAEKIFAVTPGIKRLWMSLIHGTKQHDR